MVHDCERLLLSFMNLFGYYERRIKDNGWIKGNKYFAKPDWDAFIKQKKNELNSLIKDDSVKEAFDYLVESPPNKECVAENKISWKEVSCSKNMTGLFSSIIRVRNNLYHGGKHSGEQFFPDERNLLLIKASVAILEKCRSILE